MCGNKSSLSDSILKKMDDEKWNIRLQALYKLKSTQKAVEINRR